MNSTKKNIQKTSSIHRLGKFYKPGQMEHKTQVQVRSSPIQVNNV